MRFEVLGPLRVCVGDGDGAIPLGEPQQRKLLALLLASPDRAVATERLIDEIWGDEPPPSARHLVHVYVARLRAGLRRADGRERVLRERSGYRVDVDADEVDACEFAAAIEQARSNRQRDPARAALGLRRAIGLWRGAPFSELADESAELRSEAGRLEEMYVDATTDVIDLEIELGRHRELVGELEQLVAGYPFRERFTEQLMVALYRCGRQAEALSAFQDLRRSLRDELGIEPGPAVQELDRRILLHDPDLLWEPAPPPFNVPAHVSSFIGRRYELAEVAKLLETSRMLTLTGAGGSGKTRLAAELAGQVRFRFPDGVWWIDLAPIVDAERVVATAAETFGVAVQPRTPLLESLARALARREALLVVDNCEHLAPAVAAVATELLGAAPDLRILATSRSPLKVSGEVLWTVPPLALPSSDEPSTPALELSDAIRLFVERGTAVVTDFSLTPENSGAVVDLCRRLDGLPLAIEMSAARLAVLAPEQILASLSDRFDLLTRAPRGASPRHETLEAAIDWSYDLLDPEVRPVFARLSVFGGPFAIDAAAAVAGVGKAEALEAVTNLVESSMLAVVRAEAQVTRYRMLETLREYSARRLPAGAEAHSARREHAEFHLRLAEQAGDQIGTPGFVARVEELRLIDADLRRALDWSLQHQPRSRTLRVARALFHLWFRTGDGREAGYWGRRMLDGAEDTSAALRADAHTLLSFSGNLMGDPETTVTNADTAIRLYRESDDRRGLATALFGGGNVALMVGDLERARALATEARTISEEVDDRWNRAGSLAILSFISLLTGPVDEARRDADLAVALYRDLGDIAGQVVMCPLAAIAMRQGDLAGAEAYAHEAAVVATGTAWEAAAMVGLAEVLVARKDVDGAAATARRGLVRALDGGVEIWFRRALRILAHVDALNDAAERAAQLFGASRRNAFGFEPDPAVDELIERRCRIQLESDDIAGHMRRGTEMSHAQILDLLEI
jgi:predicted ATPase/DNA-binding SARP family transcriptional activator